MTTGRTTSWSVLRARTALALAPLVMLASSSLGVAVASPAQAAVGDPVPAPVVSTLASPAQDDTPSWTVELPADPPPDVVAASDSATVTVTTSHTAECSITADGTLALGPCGPADGTTVVFTAPPLADAAWELAVRTVRTTTTTTDVGDGEPVSVPVVEASDLVTRPYVLDTTDPVVSLLRTGELDRTTASWALTVEEAGTYELACTPTGASVTTCGPDEVVVELPADGTASVEVVATDAVGRTGAATGTVVLDRFQARLEGPTGPARDDQPSWLVAGEALTGVTCALETADGTDVAGGLCSDTGYTAPPLPPTTGADYVLTVSGRDAGGTVGTLTAAYRLDSLVDLRAATEPAAVGADRRPAWTFTGEAVTVTCVLTVDGAPVPGTDCRPDGATAPLLATTPGSTYALTVEATDAVGNVRTLELGPYLLDTDVVASVVPPTSPGTVVRPGWTVVPGAGEVLVDADCTLTEVATGDPVPGTCAPTGFIADGLTTDGAYDLTIEVTDRAGSTAVLPAARYVLDRAVDVVLTPPAPVVSTPTPRWTIGGEPLAEVACALTDPAGLLVAGAADCTTTSYTAPALTLDGTYVLTVEATDLAGNTVLVSSSLELDTRVDATVTAPATPGRDRAPRWTVTGQAGEVAALECELLRGGTPVLGGTCGATGGVGSFTAPQLAETPGQDYVLRLTVVDDVGNRLALFPLPYRLDTVLDAGITAPPSPDDDPTPSWTVAGEAVTVTCVLTLADGTPVAGGDCGAGGFTAPDLSPTTGTGVLLALTLTDTAGNTSTSRFAHTVDTVLQLTIGEPPSPSSDLTPSWTFAGEPYRSVACTLTGPLGVVPGGTCTTSGYTAPELDPLDGRDHVLTVTATDLAGNVLTRSSGVHVLDAAAVLEVLGPLGPSSVTTPRWSFGGEPYTSLSCVLRDDRGAELPLTACDDGEAVAATLPATTGTTYVLTVSVVDTAGNRATAASGGYLLDTVAELAVAGPPSPGTERRPRWAVTAEAGSTVTCTLTSAAGTLRTRDCSAGTFEAPSLDDTVGTDHLLTVRSVDRAGNTATRTSAYRLDTELELSVVGPVGPGNDPQPSWSLVGERYTATTCTLTVDGRTVPGGACRLDGFTAPVLAGTTGADVELVVRATDTAGNVATVRSERYVLDTVLELVVVGPTGPSPEREPEWDLDGEDDLVLTCVLRGPGGALVPGGTCEPKRFQAPVLTADGDHRLAVTATDLAGNTRTVEVVYDLDTVALTVVGPTGPSNDRRPSWTFTDEPYTAATCELTGPSGRVVLQACTTTSAFTAPLLPETAGASYVLTVTATDSIGTSRTVASAPYLLDTRAPAVTVVGPTGAGRTTAVVWTTTVDEPPAQASCTLRRDGVAVRPLACPGSTPVDLTVTGRYDVVVAVTDLAGNRTALTGAGYVFDAVAPAAPLVQPVARVTNDPAAAWTTSAEPGTSVTCRLTRDGLLVQDWTPCPGGYARTLDVDGTWLLEVRAADSVGPGASSTASWLLDRVLPSVPVVSGPVGPSQDRAPQLTFTTEAGTTTTCRVLLGAVEVLGSSGCVAAGVPVSLLGQPDGTYVLEVTAVDAAGNRAVGRSAGYRLDTTAPAAPGVTGPTGPSPLTTPSFTLTGEQGAAFGCRLQLDGVDVGGAVACASPYVPQLVRDGTWTLVVDVTDAAGNRSASTTSPAYVLDATAPAAPTVTPPGATGRDLVPAWAVTAEPGARLQCRLTGPDTSGTFTACAAPLTTDLTGRPDGSYVLEVRAVDAAGNTGPAGAGTYLLDTTPPPAPVLSAPASPGRSRTPSVSFTAPGGTTATCRLTSGSTQIAPVGAASEPCTSPVRLNLATLPDGPYVLSVRLVDAAGNSGPASSATYVLDTTGPLPPQLVDVPASPSGTRRPVVSWVVETGATTSCRLVSPSGTVRETAGCTSPYDLDLPDLDGSYGFSVTGVDALGNAGEATTLTHVLSRTVPAGPVVTAPPSPSTDRAPVWRISGSGPFECRLARGATVLRDWTSCAAGDYRADLFAQPDGTYVLSVRVPGSASTPATSRYVLDTNGPPAPTVVAQFSPSTDRTPSWTVSSPEVGVTAECRLLLLGTVLRDWQPCGVSAAGAPVTQDLRDLGDGTFSLVVRLVDARGTTGPSTRSDYTVNTSAPPAVGVEPPASPGSATTPTWRLVAPAGTQLECRLVAPDGVVVQDWRTCAGTVTLLLDRGDGEYRLAARALSAAGTPGPETSATYRLLTAVRGELRWLVEPGGGSDRTPTWTFTLPPDTTGRCEVVEPSGVLLSGPCASPWSPTLVGVDGLYLVRLRAVDAAGNVSAPLASTYALKTSPAPPPVLTLEPGSPSASDAPQWRFTTVLRASAECQLLREGVVVDDWAACTSPYEGRLFARPDGRYELRVRSVAADLRSDFVASGYVFDRSAVATPRITEAPASPGTTTTPTWRFSGPVGASFECRTDGGPWTACNDRVAVGAVPTGTWTLALGPTTSAPAVVEIRLLGADGRTGAATTGSYVLDLRPPDAVRFAGEPGLPFGGAGYGTAGDVRWTIQPVAPDESTTCQLSGPRPVPPSRCDDGFATTLTQEGRYVLTVYAVDAAGRRGPSTTSTYVYDRTPPEVPRFTSRPPASGTPVTTAWAFDLVPGDVASCVVLLGVEPVVAEQDCSAGAFVVRLAGQAPGTYVLQVRVVDRAGNPGRGVLRGSYALQSVTPAPVRLGGPVPTPPEAPATPQRPVVPGVPVVPAVEGAVPLPVLDPPISEDDVVRGLPVVPLPTGDEDDDGSSTGGRTQALEDLLAGAENIPEALSGTLAEAIRRPTLPLALLAIVFLFLVAQNQIDRRDPKLAAAPLEAEPELDFNPFVRRPGGAT